MAVPFISVDRSFKILLLALTSLLLLSCETVSYYGQAVSGQLYILSHRQKLEKLIAADTTGPALRSQLQTVLAIRRFADSELGLPVGRNYGTYVDVQRPYVVWNVFATPEFDMQPLRWCYPVAGCVSYRGYFAEAAARDFAGRLAAQGRDVYVGGVAAYSTLGWFSDSILNTVIHRKDHQLASLIFHELAHQQVYIPGATEFNESFATAVEKEGLRRWLQHEGLDTEAAADIIENAEVEERRRERFVALVQDTIKKLAVLYDSDASLAQKRQGKQEIFTRMKAAYQSLKQSWQGYDGYDAWFAQDLNNAQLSTVATYFDLVPAFQSMLIEANFDLPAFYQQVRALSKRPQAARDEYLRGRLQQKH
ncbi:MAG: aminopeptidase [Pseudomonadales bacterium]|nr:aminopeptidase [Pseudomonadales bacterium]